MHVSQILGGRWSDFSLDSGAYHNIIAAKTYAQVQLLWVLCIAHFCLFCQFCLSFLSKWLWRAAEFNERNWPEHACGGSGNIRVVELFRRATAHPRLCGLKARSWFIKSELSIRARSAKWRSQYICGIQNRYVTSWPHGGRIHLYIFPAYLSNSKSCRYRREI